MRFERVQYEETTGEYSKQIESYNFHKAASVLAEYGFDCVRITNDWRGADFLAYHSESGQTLEVQLKSSLVVAEKYLAYPDLYVCFPLDGTGNWYLVKHSRLMEIVKENAPHWFNWQRWKNNKNKRVWHWTGNEAIRDTLKEFAYAPKHQHLGYREARNREHPTPIGEAEGETP